MIRRVKAKLNSYSFNARLIAGIILSGGIYAAFTAAFPLTKYYNIVPPLDYTKLTNYSLAGFLAYVLGIGVLFGVYIWSLRLFARGQFQINIRFVVITSAIFALILVFSYPQTAIDIFIYAIRSRGWALYNMQPLATAPEMLPATDQWLGLSGEWADAPSPYGPVWEWLSLGAFGLIGLSGGHFLGHLLALKGITALAYLGCVWWVYLILRNLRPDWATAGTIAFAWNPLVLFESVQNGHNDIVMVFFLLAAIWAFLKIEPHKNLFMTIIFCIFMAASILVKFVTVAVLPFFLLAIANLQPKWYQRVLSLVSYGSLITVLIIIGMLPFWPGVDHWAILHANSGAGRSLLALLVLGLKNTLGTNPAFDLSRGILYGVCGVVFLYYTWKILTKRDQSKALPITAAFYLLFWYVLLAAPTFHAWYLLWFLPLGSLLLPQQRPLIAGIIFSITALYAIPYFETIRVWFPILLQNHFLGHIIGVSLLILPPIYALLRPVQWVPNSITPQKSENEHGS